MSYIKVCWIINGTDEHKMKLYIYFVVVVVVVVVFFVVWYFLSVQDYATFFAIATILLFSSSY